MIVNSQGIESSTLQIEVCTDISQLGNRADVWNRLVDSSVYPSVFRRFEWLSSWWNVFGKADSFSVFLVYDHGDLVAALPMYLSEPRLFGRFVKPRLRLIGIGGPTCPEYLGIIVSSEHVEPVSIALADHLESCRRRYHEIEFADIVTDDFPTRVLVEKLSGRFSLVTTPGESNPYLHLPNTYEDFWKDMSAEKRKRKLYQVRRAEKEFGARVVCVSDPGEFDQAFLRMRQLSALSHGRLNRKSPFQNDAYLQFHLESAKLLARSGLARCYFLIFGDSPVAFVYGYAYSRKFMSFQIGFDPEFGKFSPGDVLHQMIYRQLIETGFDEFDYLRGDEPYKFAMTNLVRQSQTYRIFANRLHGRLHRSVRVLRAWGQN